MGGGDTIWQAGGKRDAADNQRLLQRDNRPQDIAGFYVARHARVAQRREPAQLQGGIRPCRANRRGDASCGVQVRL